MIKVFLKGPDGKQKTVTIKEDATVRDVASDGYHLFCSIRFNSENSNGVNLALVPQTK